MITSSYLFNKCNPKLVVKIVVVASSSSLKTGVVSSSKS